MAGIANTWIDQYYTTQTPCINNTSGGAGGSSSGTLSSCLVWLAIGMLLGSITFQKKGTQQ